MRAQSFIVSKDLSLLSCVCRKGTWKLAFPLTRPCWHTLCLFSEALSGIPSYGNTKLLCFLIQLSEEPSLDRIFEWNVIVPRIKFLVSMWRLRTLVTQAHTSANEHICQTGHTRNLDPRKMEQTGVSVGLGLWCLSGVRGAGSGRPVSAPRHCLFKIHTKERNGLPHCPHTESSSWIPPEVF